MSRNGTNNALKRHEEFAVADAIRALENPLADWSIASRYFTTIAQRPVTKRNIEGICRDLNIELDRVVASYHKSSSPMSNMAAQIADLQARVADLESLLK